MARKIAQAWVRTMPESPAHLLAACMMSIAAMGLPAIPASAQAPASQANADPAFTAAKIAYEALPETERKAIQNDLVWSGDYNGVVDGGYGRRTHDGILAFERRTKAQADGILSAAERKTLADLAGRARERVKFAVLSDAKSGTRLGIPATMLTRRSDVAGGTQWSGAIGEANLTTRKLEAVTLEALYETRVSDTAQGRKVTYKVLRPDWFVIAGETGGRRFYTRYAKGPNDKGENELRGYTISYEGSAAVQWEPLVIAIANSFEPFLSASAAGPMAGATSPSTPSAATLGAASGNASVLVLAAGKAVTPRVLLDGCKSITVAGRPARISPTLTGDLALLDVDGLPAPSALSLRKDVVASAETVTLGFGAGTLTGDSLSAAPGDVTASADGALLLLAALQPGTGGAPVFDRSGRLIGLVARNPAANVQVAGLVPAMRHRLIPASAIAPALTAAASPARDATATLAISIGEIAARASSNVARLTCIR